MGSVIQFQRRIIKRLDPDSKFADFYLETDEIQPLCTYITAITSQKSSRTVDIVGQKVLRDLHQALDSVIDAYNSGDIQDGEEIQLTMHILELHYFSLILQLNGGKSAEVKKVHRRASLFLQPSSDIIDRLLTLDTSLIKEQIISDWSIYNTNPTSKH